MEYLQIILLGAGLAMDAFAVTVINSICMKDFDWKKGLSMPLTFGIFQAAMPTAGFFLGSLLMGYIEKYDHWVAFALLLGIGLKMILDAVRDARKKSENPLKPFKIGEIILQGVATSIDALAVGITLTLSDIPIWADALIIGAVTFIISGAGVVLGRTVGKKIGGKVGVATVIGGAALIGIGIKILVEGLI